MTTVTFDFTIPSITEERDAPWSTTLYNRLDSIVDAIDNLNDINPSLLTKVIRNLDVIQPGINSYQDFLNKQELNYDANEMDMRLLYKYNSPVEAIYDNLPEALKIYLLKSNNLLYL